MLIIEKKIRQGEKIKKSVPRTKYSLHDKTTMCLLSTKDYKNSHLNSANYTRKVCLGQMIHVGNDRIHIHI